MAKKVFKNTDDLMKYVRIQAQKALEDVVDKEVIPEIQRAILSEVYEKYTPNGWEPYERRGEQGGLADITWLQEGKTIESGDNFVKIHVRSIAPKNGKSHWVQNSYMLDAIIVDGDKYTWKNSDIYWMQPYKRDFYKVAKEVLEDKLPRVMRRTMKKHGLNCDFKIKIN